MSDIYVVKCSDKRMECLCKMLGEEGKKIAFCEEALTASDRAVYVMPPNLKITVDIAEKLRGNSAVFCGKTETPARAILEEKKCKVFELLQYGQYVSKNAVCTAECAILPILKWEKSMLINRKILVLGFGKVGRATVACLRPFCHNITVMTSRPDEAVIYADAITKNECDFSAYDLIISTIPHNVLERADLLKIKSGAKLFELASPPYSFDVKTADELGVDYEILAALPSKVKPQAAAELMLEVIKSEEENL